MIDTKYKKSQVFQYIQKNSNSKMANGGFETKDLAIQFGMQRSNMSSILNELVIEGKLTKSKTRPVLYKLPNQKYRFSDQTCFASMIGYRASLKNAIQLAKAAILYPDDSLNVAIIAKTGTGVSTFARKMFDFAKENEILNVNSPFVKLDVKNYVNHNELLDDSIFGRDDNVSNSVFDKANEGMLFIDGFDFLTPHQQNQILNFAESGIVYNKSKTKFNTYEKIILIISASNDYINQLHRNIPVIIELPDLKDRSYEERLELICNFFMIESTNVNRSIQVSSDVIQALLITDFSHNVKELQVEIKSATANAYVRVIHDAKENLFICLNDLKNSTKRNIIKYKNFKNEISESMKERMETNFYFSPLNGEQNSDNEIYKKIQNQFKELSLRGVNQNDIVQIINRHTDNLIHDFNENKVIDDRINIEHLSKIVDSKIIELTRNFLNRCQTKLKCHYNVETFYGLTLHINALFKNNENFRDMINNDQIESVFKNYPEEYLASFDFASELESNFGLKLPIEEVILITLFLVEKKDDENSKPVLMYIMHGNGVASSLAKVTNALTKCSNPAYFYDMDLDKPADIVLKEIRTMILNIDQGKGVIVIYDMGSIKTMLDTLSQEINVKIRYLNIPITLIGIDIVRKCINEKDIDIIYHNVVKNFDRKDDNNNSNKLIITLCHSGEGGAIQLKNYIDMYSKLKIKTIALAISDREELLKEIIELKRTYNIYAFVGTYDPNLFGIPFISISKIFEISPTNLDKVLCFEPVLASKLDYNSVYDYLEEQLKYVSISKLKMVMPEIVDRLSVFYGLDENETLGVFVHLSCLIERLLEGKIIENNLKNNKIIEIFYDDYVEIKKLLKKLENMFKVIIDDNEISIIMMMVKKI